MPQCDSSVYHSSSSLNQESRGALLRGLATPIPSIGYKFSSDVGCVVKLMLNLLPNGPSRSSVASFGNFDASHGAEAGSSSPKSLQYHSIRSLSRVRRRRSVTEDISSTPRRSLKRCDPISMRRNCKFGTSSGVSVASCKVMDKYACALGRGSRDSKAPGGGAGEVEW